ncbi:hypothetical protein HGRIS_007681 [Hohenbuehelia grisea]|uniref:Ino eighty subunit 1 n=1 Tax=Hohenbuehelia grisea TaxID=104357 RepID=A0ABR3J620_9AGAR
MSQKPAAQISRKTLAIKRTDGEPLLRTDLQYDVLHNIFTDDHAVFTDPHQTLHGDPAGTKVCFRDLYVNAIMRSPKATKVLREKMQDVPTFATDFAMLALLTNVGRINTTMSFFPEMKTAIRTYHPIPALQRTAGNLQDAPRIKHILKACILDEEEGKNAPSTPSDILSRSSAGQIPSTTITNLIFVMANFSAPLGQSHFPEDLEFLDLFLPVKISSASRARAFLWLCYHFLEAPSLDQDDDYDADGSAQPNPFSEQRSPGRLPPLIRLTPEEYVLENQDSEAEKELGVKLVEQRAGILKNHTAKGHLDVVGDDDDKASVASEPKPKGRRGAAASLNKAASAKEKKTAADKTRRERLKKVKAEKEAPLSAPPSFDDDERGGFPPEKQRNQYPALLSNERQYPTEAPQHVRRQGAPRHASSQTPEPPSHRPHPYLPYKHYNGRHSRSRNPRPAAPPRSMLQQTWHVVTHSDPLVDSDDEFADEHVRHDYIQRLQLLTRLQQQRFPDEEPSPQMDVDSGSVTPTYRRPFV